MARDHQCICSLCSSVNAIYNPRTEQYEPGRLVSSQTLRNHRLADQARNDARQAAELEISAPQEEDSELERIIIAETLSDAVTSLSITGDANILAGDRRDRTNSMENQRKRMRLHQPLSEQELQVLFLITFNFS